jgi:hypothetical protein
MGNPTKAPRQAALLGQKRLVTAHNKIHRVHKSRLALANSASGGKPNNKKATLGIVHKK